MRLKQLALLAAIGALLGAFSPASAMGASMTVDCQNANGQDNSELQVALDQSEDGDTIGVAEGAVCHGGYDMEANEITLQGEGSGATLSGDLGEGRTRILLGEDVGETVIKNLTFVDGDAAEGDGGAIYLTGDSPATIEDNLFINNEANRGGAVAVDYFAGPIFLLRADGTRDVTLRDNVFGRGEDVNFADDRGGAVYIQSTDPVDITGNEFSGNDTNGSGGGLYVIADSPLTLVDNGFFGNSAGARGGGATGRICSGATINGNVFDDNLIRDPFPNGQAASRELRDGPLGAGLHLARRFCEIVEVAGRQNGEDFDVHQSGNDFTNNILAPRHDGRPSGGGAGEAIQQLSTKSTDDYFYGNEAQHDNGQDGGGEGGGLYVEGDFQQVVFEGRNLVAAANAVLRPEEGGFFTHGRGGGIYMGFQEAPGQLRLFDSTIVSNEAGVGSGIDGDSCDSLVLHNSIVALNTGQEGDEINGFDAGEACSDIPRSSRAAGDPGTRDVQFSDVCSGQNSDVVHEGQGNICADPLLVNPGGGDVHQTSNSPTLERGSNALVPSDLSGDFEGDARIADANGDGTAVVDMGADEAEAPAPPAPAAPGPGPTAAAEGCLNSQGGVSGRRLGPVQLGRRRAAQRALMRGAQLLTRLGLDKYCVTGGGLFRIGYPTEPINDTIGRSLRRAVRDRVVIALTSSPRFTLGSIRPSQTSEATARRRLRGERRFRIGKNNWYVTGAPKPVRGAQRGGVLRLVKAQRGRVREIGIGDARLARGDRLQLKRYLKTWAELGF